MEPFITCDNLVKIYKVAELEVIALQGLDLTIQKGELIGIVGTSGSGKSTFLNVLGGLDRPSAGRVTVNGRDLLKLDDQELDSYRLEEVGFIWQQSARNLLPYLTAQENIELPMNIAGHRRKERQEWSAELLHAVGLWEHRQHKLAQLSGGQQQRVAIAVALANQPSLLLGDEPTGELDSVTADEILELFQEMNKQYGLTTIIVTHDPTVSRAVERVITIRDGRTSSETVRRQRSEGAPTSSTPTDAVPSPLVGDAASFDEYVVVDGVGRLQIPPEVREKIGLGGRVTITVTEEGGVLVKPVKDSPSNTNNGASPVVQEEKPAQQKGLSRWLKKLRS